MNLVRTLPWAACLLAGLITTSAAAAPRIVGGQTMTDSREAPWTVNIQAERESGGGGRCSGSILDANRVITAAHCLYDGSDGPPSPMFFKYTVRAGIVDVRKEADQSHLQTRVVAKAMHHPDYDFPRRDVAIMTLETPLDLSGPYVQPIKLTSATTAPGSAVRLYGYGANANDGGTVSVDGQQRYLDSFTTRSYACADGKPSLLCGFSPLGASCRGDSGGGLVTSGPAPVLVGLSSFSQGEPCAAYRLSGYTDLGAPEIANWVAGRPYTAAPTSTAKVSASFTAAGPVAGATVTCTPPAFSGAPTVKSMVLDAQTGAIIATGVTSVLPDAAIGRSVLCLAEATNAGGRTESASAAFKVLPPVDPENGVRLNKRGRISIFSQAEGAVPAQLVFKKNGRVVKTRSFTFESIPAAAPRLARGKYQVCLTTARFSIYAESTVCTTWRRR